MVGDKHRDTLYSSIHLASLRRLQGKSSEALTLLMEALTVAEDAYSSR